MESIARLSTIFNLSYFIYSHTPFSSYDDNANPIYLFSSNTVILTESMQFAP